MKTHSLILAGLLVLVILAAGCAGKQSDTPPASTSGGAGSISGDITAPAGQGVAVEDLQTSPDESVDLGSLI